MSAAAVPVIDDYAAHAAAEFAGASKGLQLQALGPVLQGEFERAVLMRRQTEERWLKDFRQYRGKYDPEELTAMGRRSRVFMRKTRVKVKTIDSRVADLLFPAGSEKNWEIGPTPKPLIGTEQRQQIKQQMLDAAAQIIEQQKQQQAQQGAPQGPNAAPPQGAFPAAPTAAAMPQQMPPEPTDDEVDALVAEFVAKASKKMSKTIEDQLTECRYKDVCVRVVHSGHLFGTGVMKGPLVTRKTHTHFTKVQEEKLDAQGNPVMGEDGQPVMVMRWKPVTELQVVPFVEYVPLWRFYPDMSVTEIEDCRYAWERHFMSRSRMIELSKRASFRRDVIMNHIRANQKGSRSNGLSYDSEIRDIGDRREDASGADNGTYEVLERWGWLTGRQLKEAGYNVADSRIEEDFFSNVWMLHTGEVIKVALSPIDGSTWPYHLYHFDKDESSIFGEGLASVMRDDQAMLNASIRIMLDNAAITSGPQLEMNMELLAKGENPDEIVPWKIWKRTGAHPEQKLLSAISIPNHLEDLTKMAALFESNADEVTAIPRYMSGENATQGAAGTAAGMSMLMAAANIVIKDLITAWDEGVTRPFLQGLYHWNMKFNPDDSIKGDYDVKARGTASLVAKEVRARSLNEFSALVANPLDAPYINRHKLLQQRAEALELDGIVYTEEQFKEAQNSPEAMAQKQLQMGMAQAQLDELRAKIALGEANAKLATAKVEELVANVKIAMEGAVVAMSKTMVETIYAALQAGQVATASPFAAPAADQILSSSGFQDRSPDVPIADLNRQPVQATEGQMQLVNKGQGYIEPQREAPTTNEVPGVNQPEPEAPPPESPIPDLQPQTGMVGRRQGIETVEND